MLLLLLQAEDKLAFPVPAPDAVADSQMLTDQEPTAGPMGQARAHCATDPCTYLSKTAAALGISTTDFIHDFFFPVKKH